MYVPTMDIPNAAIKKHTSMLDVASYLHSLKPCIYTSYFDLEPSFPHLCTEGIVIFYSYNCNYLWFPLLCNKDYLVLSDLPDLV